MSPHQAEVKMLKYPVVSYRVGVFFNLNGYLESSPADNWQIMGLEFFIQATLQQTTRCEMGRGYLDVKDLIYECTRESECLNGDGPLACDVLEQTIDLMLENSWGPDTGENRPYKGYELAIVFNRGQEDDVDLEQLMDPFTEGIVGVGNFRESSQTFAKSGQDITIYLKVFS